MLKKGFEAMHQHSYINSCVCVQVQMQASLLYFLDILTESYKGLQRFKIDA